MWDCPRQERSATIPSFLAAFHDVPVCRAKKIAERNVFNAGLEQRHCRLHHKSLIMRIRAGPWQIHVPQGISTASARASTSSRRTACMATRFASWLNVREEPYDFIVILVAEKVRTPSTVRSTAPRKQCPFHGKFSGLVLIHCRGRVSQFGEHTINRAGLTLPAMSAAACLRLVTMLSVIADRVNYFLHRVDD